MTQQEAFIFSGFGGQGVMFVGQLLAYTAMDCGLNVTWIPSYGPEMRGGTANCTVVISEKPIGSPIVRFPSVAVVFNLPSFDKYEPVIASGGLLVSNSSLVDQTSERDDITLLQIPGTDSADDLGNVRVTNLIMLGAALTARPVLTVDDVRASLADHIPAHRRNLLDLNYAALDRGVELASDLLVTA
ncbi:MAG: 2-oxoacid:ferredoxin oxidoreductase subunit gamma [Chloroflexi bacterium]|nr:2-oxoacid:ferredoxin oxidoreductase subunit gamma [Chloroflexota bacterium]